MLAFVVTLSLLQKIPHMLNMAVISALKILNLMVKLNSRCYIVKVKNVQYLVKYGHLDEFVALFMPSVVYILCMSTAPVSWEHVYQWYKRV